MGRSVCTENGGELSSSYGESHRHQAVVYSFEYADQLASKCCLYSKAYACFPSLLSSSSIPKEGVDSASLTQFTVFTQFSNYSGFTESRDVHVISREFACDQCCASLGSVCSVVKRSNVPRSKVQWDDPCCLLILVVISTASVGSSSGAVNWLRKGGANNVWNTFSNPLLLPWR